jgi:hypothetical protein
MVPGPPFLSFVAYFQADKSKIDEDTPFGRVARPFFYGNDDEFRNNRFKLIPKVVDGNMIIKMAVKDTPTLLGNKLKQYYYKSEYYFELDVGKIFNIQHTKLFHFINLYRRGFFKRGSQCCWTCNGLFKEYSC